MRAVSHTASSRNRSSTDSSPASPCDSVTAPPILLWKRDESVDVGGGMSLGAEYAWMACAEADDSNGEADGKANAETEREVDKEGECAGQGSTLSVGEADVAVVGP